LAFEKGGGTMGAEDFLVRVETEVNATMVVRELLAIPGIIHDAVATRMPSSIFLRFEDAEHIVELEVQDRDPCVVSARFALCHPASIEQAFGALVGQIARVLAGRVSIAEDVEPDVVPVDTVFGPPDWNSLTVAIEECVDKKRGLWQADFGTKTARASCREALERFVIGR
jgi:hypothetical protein